MKKLALILCVLALGCGKAPEPKPQPQVQEIEDAPTLDKDKTYTIAFYRGYNDGFNGNWLAPLNWLVANDYRNGWSAGAKDRKEDNPHFFNSKNWKFK